MDYKVEDCFLEIRNGISIKQGIVAGGFPITRIETLADNKFNRDRMGYAGITEIDKYSDYVLEDGDLLMSHINSPKYLGRTVVYHKYEGEVFIHGMNLLKLRTNRDILCPDFAEYLFASFGFRSQISKIMKKSVNQASFSVSDLRKISVKIPSLSKQREIINKLHRVKQIVNDRNIQLEMFDELIKSRFVEMFGDENNPKNWNYVLIDEVAEVQVGVVIKPAQYYTDKKNGNKAFRSLNVGELKIKDNDWVYFNNEGNKINSRSILKENDILIVRSGAPGTACVVTKEFEGSNAIDVIIAHANENLVNPYYLAAYTNFPHGKNQIIEGTGGAAQQHFNVGRYKTMKLMLPPIKLQNEYNAFIKQVDKLKFDLEKDLGET